MTTDTQATTDGRRETRRRQLIRYAGATLAAVTALIYFLIGFNIVTVIEVVPGEASVQSYFGIPAALAYMLGALLLVAFQRRLLWILGALLQVFVIYTYFNLAPQRVPDFELWGILIRVAQVLLLGTLVYLVLHSDGDGRRAHATTAST